MKDNLMIHLEVEMIRLQIQRFLTLQIIEDSKIVIIIFFKVLASQKDETNFIDLLKVTNFIFFLKT